MPSKYPTADHGTPRTDWGAAPKSYRSVKNAHVIEVEAATHRGCEPFSGIFELVAPTKEPRMRAGKLSAEVYCAWHGTKPFTCFPHLHVVGKYEVRNGYTGMVVDNIA